LLIRSKKFPAVTGAFLPSNSKTRIPLLVVISTIAFPLRHGVLPFKQIGGIVLFIFLEQPTVSGNKNKKAIRKSNLSLDF
jgi:hypothetical protein